MTTRTVQEIKVSEVRELLKSGVTRFRADDEGYGSIEEKYSLSPAGVRRLFQNEYLKGLKTIVPEFILVVDVDDRPAAEDIEETPDELHEIQAVHDAIFAEPTARANALAAMAQQIENEIEKVEAEDAIPKEDSLSDLFK